MGEDIIKGDTTNISITYEATNDINFATWYGISKKNFNDENYPCAAKRKISVIINC